MSVTQALLGILLTPLVSAGLILLFLRRRHNAAAAVSVASAAIGAVLAGWVLWAAPASGAAEVAGQFVNWLTLGSFHVDLGFLLDPLTCTMLFVVTFVGFCIHVFSLGYMRDDDSKARFFGGLSVFMFSMLGIVLARNLFMIFIFWELVGFSSYMLIDHYFTKTSAANASKKAFITNRVGDLGFLIGILGCYFAHGTTDFTALAEIFANPDMKPDTWIALCLFCGVLGKSAQVPLHVWLPDAMEGPTPVSALIHAATMVAAGVFLLARTTFLQTADSLECIAWVGTGTAAFAACCAFAQTDIKKVLAYSTLSQLGFMVAIYGVGTAYGTARGMPGLGAAAAMFHLTTHAFFKALLFLGSGSVIHACHHEQEIFRMGGLWKKLPVTFATFTLGVAAIIGVPYLSGFFSKDIILWVAQQQNTAVYGTLLATAVLTATYMGRLWVITFLGKPRSDEASHAHESPLSMTLPLVVLAALAVVGGYAGVYPASISGLWTSLPEIPHGDHTMLLIVSSVMAVNVPPERT